VVPISTTGGLQFLRQMLILVEMKQMRRPIYWSVLLCTLLLTCCAPPWHGEEDNFPILALCFEDTTTGRHVPWADLGVTSLEHLEHHVALPIGNAMAQPNMNFDSRLNEAEYLLLPLDKGNAVSTFVLHSSVGADTLRVTWPIKYGLSRRGKWDADGRYLTKVEHTFSKLGFYYEEESGRRSPYYHPRVLDWIWVVL
jgi:hypothetical protein